MRRSVLIRNVDYPERFIRIVVGLVLGNLGFANPGFAWLEGTDAIQVAATSVGLYLVPTGLFGFCPLYLLRRHPPSGR